MKAIVSSTHDSKYLFFLPIITWCWNKLGVDVICFMPYAGVNIDLSQLISWNTKGDNMIYLFKAPEHKEATYAQCARLYAACIDLPEDEVIITSDIDMALFQIPSYIGGFTVVGSDLTPLKQYPICYLSATVKEWRNTFLINGRSYQQCLDDLLGHIEASNFRGNYWSKDQEEAYNKIVVNPTVNHVPRSNGSNQFATKRVDRDDSYWEDRLNYDVIDAHLWRPGYSDENFPKIMKLLKFFYPNEDFTWLENYRNEYIRLL